MLIGLIILGNTPHVVGLLVEKKTRAFGLLMVAYFVGIEKELSLSA